MELLDTTVRDGSYAVDFKFTCEDVKDIVVKSETIGFKYIEIGHGLGLNASNKEHGVALHTDQEYILAAREVVKDAKLGCFCIPGIATLEDLRRAKDDGLSFVRIGVSALRPEDAKEYVIEAKKLGYIVMVNFMKTYVISPEQFGANVKVVEAYGADYVYIVDSAGCMLPEDIRKYYEAVRKNSDIKVGFHGHDNIGLAVSNSVYCAELGMDMIDCSFQGLGRSSGNASTEKVIMTMMKKGILKDVDIPRTLEYGYAALRNIVPKKLEHPLDLMCGYAGFHSGFLKDIYRCCVKNKVDPLRLILAYSEIDKVGMDFDKLCTVSKKLPVDIERNPYGFNDFFSEIFND